MEAFDYAVVGQGLAGTAVAWRLRWRGRRVVVIDRGEPGTASRVAAGLITPITGQRLAKSWRLDEFLPVAAAFYRRVEAETGAACFLARAAVRLFTNEQERTWFLGRKAPSLGVAIALPDPPLNKGWFTAPHGGFEMTTAARLDVPRYLDASRDFFARDGGFVRASLDPVRDIEFTPDGVRFQRLGVRAGGVIFCQGFDARGNPRHPDVRFNAAKGEILTLRVPGLAEDRVVHRGVWLAPLGGDLFRAGATYDRDDLTPTPTAVGREQILGEVRAFLQLPFEVVGHAAGVRPVVDGGVPVSGVHPQLRRVAFLNGLGSKGVLLAPSFAARLVDQLGV